MAKWDYMRLKTRQDDQGLYVLDPASGQHIDYDVNLEVLLGHLGQEGWELVSVLTFVGTEPYLRMERGSLGDNTRTTRVEFFFKRPM